MNAYTKATFSVYYHDIRNLEKQQISFTQDSVKGFWKSYEILMNGYETAPFDLRPQLSKLEVPTLIIHEDHYIIPFSTAKEIHAAMPTSNLVVIKDSDHLPFIEKPDEFFGVINEFLKHNIAK